MRVTKRYLKRIIREEARRARRLAEDSIADELDHLRKNIDDDKDHIDALEKDIDDDRDEMERAHEEEKKKHESRRRIHRRLQRIIREDHEDWGMGKGEESRTHPGEEDYTGHEGDLSKTHPGEEDYEGDDVELKAHTALAAIQDLASAAGVELEPEAPGPEVAVPGVTVALESRRRRRALKRHLSRTIRETLRRRR